MMIEQTDLTENNYLTELYEDLYIKSAIDIDATIAIISWIEELSCGGNTINQKDVFPETCCLPGKSTGELVGEFKGFWATNTKKVDLSNIWELRSSLYRFQSL